MAGRAVRRYTTAQALQLILQSDSESDLSDVNENDDASEDDHISFII